MTAAASPIDGERSSSSAPFPETALPASSMALSEGIVSSTDVFEEEATKSGGIVGDQDPNTRSSVDDDDDGNGTADAYPTSPPPPTIQEIAEALDVVADVEPTIYSFTNTVNDDDDGDDYAYYNTDENNHPKPPAYTATTVAAISSLMKDEAFINTDDTKNSDDSKGGMDNDASGGGGTATPPSTKSSSRRELTLQDRASAMISVYKDYIHEGEKHNTTTNSVDESGDSEEEDEGGKLHDIRRWEIKNAALQKFCKDVLSTSSSSEDDDDDDDDDDEDYIDDEDEFIDDTTGSNLGRGAHTYTNILMPPAGGGETTASSSTTSSSFLGRRKKRRMPPPTPRPKLPPPTAATTTAAFRLRAEVALKAVSTKTSNVAKRAAHAVGTAVRDKMTNTANIQEMMMNEVTNDYDFQDYHTRESEGTNATGNIDSSKKKLDKNGRRGGRGGVQDERLDDLEYGQISTPEASAKDGGEKAVYGMHILDRDTSSSFRRKMDSKDEEIFHELCDDLGVTPNTHPRMRYFYEPPPSALRYRYPIFRSKKFKQAMLYFAALLLFLLVSVSIISAVSNGFEEVRRKNAPPLPDWKGEDNWQMKQKVEWETKTELFEKVSAAYRPVWYDRSTGWKGQTYDEAMSWCKSYLNYIPCPYEVYCPDEKTLLSGVMEKGGESWAPVINAKNEWVQVGGAGEPCALYSMLYGSHPAWGKNGARDEVTRNIMCCRSSPLPGGSSWNDTRKGEDEYVVRPKVPPTKYEGEQSHQQQIPSESSSSAEVSPGFDLDVLFFSVSKKYNPVWFDRSSGWKGQTYQEALDFCANFKSYIPCPYDVVSHPFVEGSLLRPITDKSLSYLFLLQICLLVLPP